MLSPLEYFFGLFSLDIGIDLGTAYTLVSVRGKGPTVLATFILSTGPGGNCNGSAWVRMRFRGDRITVFHQLPKDPRGDQAPA